RTGRGRDGTRSWSVAGRVIMPGRWRCRAGVDLGRGAAVGVDRVRVAVLAGVQDRGAVRESAHAPARMGADLAVRCDRVRACAIGVRRGQRGGLVAGWAGAGSALLAEEREPGAAGGVAGLAVAAALAGGARRVAVG